MRIFITGASGFVGSAIVQQLLQRGHEVLGLVRSEQATIQLTATRAAVLRGDVNDPEILWQGASTCDAVIHTAFNHDFSQFKANCEADRKVIETLGEALVGTDKPLVITSGTGLLRADRAVTEDDRVSDGSDVVPRAASEEAAAVAAAKGVDVYTVRLPASVHGVGDHGFIPILIGLAREKGESAYVAEGANRWPAVHRFDAAAVYRLIVEKRPILKVFHAVAEDGIPFREIAEEIGKGLGLPIVGKTGDAITAHFGWFAHFAAMGCTASSEKTRKTLGWMPSGSGLLADITHAGYLA
ncbi:SDR family oxidoreductase [Parapedobacter koreensis]|uniref:Nucleoside-diphosphate-sugar epimerase n=1 Tax=Parapedobacter koreensis TaxID=332977 RepID=A0A1H7T358_9SPHI|nr:SDR family oxidoreductase [Parapedobacter koreensis]SEL78684.1 Nucleoside-diphosphate-sugar epimerase [Parapedobacter koreensis]